MAVYTHINIPYTITGGLSTGANGGVNTLSGYTCALSRFKFQINPSTTYYNLSPYLSNDLFIWDLGDGTRVKGTSAYHIYKYPGVYTVSLLSYSSGGQEYLSTITKEISVGNFLNDSLSLDTADVINVVNIPAKTKMSRIKLNRQNSWQPHHTLSAVGYTVNLYASGSLSESLNVNKYSTFKWAHLDQAWSFYEPLTANNGAILYNPIKNIQTTNDKDIYVVEGVAKSAQTFTMVGSSFLASTSGISAVFVGTSGAAEFLYVDAKPKLTEEPVFVYGYLDTSNFPSHKHLISNYPSVGSPLKYFEHYGVTIPVRVRYSPAKDIQFTSSGIRSMDISKIKYQLTDIPLFVGFGDNYEGITGNYPSLNVLPTSGNTIESADTYTVNLSVVSGSNADFTNTVLLSTHYFKQSDSQLPDSIPGTFRGHFIPVETSNHAKVIGSVIVDDVPNFPKDINFGYITNNDHGNEIRLFFKSNFNINNETGIQTNTKEIVKTKVKYSTESSSTLTNKYAPTSVVWKSDDLANNAVLAYITNTDSSTLSSFNTHNQIDNLFDINSVYVTDTGQVKNITNNYYLNVAGPQGKIWAYPDASTNATSISIDEGRNVYVAIPELSLVEFLSGNRTGSTIGNDIFANVSTNRTYTSVVSGQSELSVTKGIDIVENTQGRNNLDQPSIVEAGRHNNVWIAFTNPLSSSLKLYGNSTQLSAAYEFDQPLSITDLSVDNTGNCWASVQNKHRHLYGYTNEGTVNDYQRSLSALGIAGAATKADNQFNYVFTATSFTVSANEILQVDGFNVAYATSWYDGTFLVDSVSANPTKTSVAVTPYIGNYNQAATSTGSETVSALKRPSDRVYKFDASGTKLFSVSGLLNPTKIVTDQDQNLWVSHNVDTLTKILSSGEFVSVQDYTSDFSADVDGWNTEHNAAVLSSTYSPLGEGNQNAAIKLVADTTDAYHRVYKDISVTAGKKYKITAKIYIPSGGSNIRGFQFRYANGTSGPLIHPTLDTWYDFSYEYTAAGTTYDGRIEFWMANSSTVDELATYTWVGATSDIFYITDIVVTDLDNNKTIDVNSTSFVNNYVSAGSDLTTGNCPLSTVQHHIGGLSFDTYGNLLVINGFENKIFSIPSSNLPLSSEYVIGSNMSSASSDHGFTYGRLNGLGDWTGFSWLNKYKNTTGIRTVTGETTFSVYNSGGKYKIRKVNENFDPQETLKSYRFSSNLLDLDTLFDDLIGTIVGSVSSDSDALGRVIYEKIANFPDNTSDPETCNINALYSLCEQYSVDINNYNLEYPGKLKRIVDLVSIPHHKLWGHVEKYDRDVHLTQEGENYRIANLGDPLTFNTYVVSAGQPIVAKHLFGSQYRKVETGFVAPWSLSGWGSSRKIDNKLDIVKFNIFSVAMPGATRYEMFKVQYSDDGETWSDISLSLSEQTILIRSGSVPAWDTNLMDWDSVGPHRYWRFTKTTGRSDIDSIIGEIQIWLNTDSNMYTGGLADSRLYPQNWTASDSVLNWDPAKIADSPSETGPTAPGPGAALDNANFKQSVAGDYIQLDLGYWQNPHYVSKYDVVSAYPLSAFTPYWGWGIGNDLSGADIEKHVKFYEYKSQHTNFQLEGVIDWSNPQTTLSRTTSGMIEWTEDYGIMENLIDVELRKGLQLFSSSLSSYTPGVL